ncbi:hypothetical protein [Enterococcus nangangensis]|uniref:hypothetical protein n=1 Tax=Enterococcus nangangensis TaxID=2559926 RepID=UPI0010FA6333|nr:hypothetical protein [Enterococcus nangangensis]
MQLSEKITNCQLTTSSLPVLTISFLRIWNVEDYPELLDIGQWLIKRGNFWKVVLPPDSPYQDPATMRQLLIDVLPEKINFRVEKDYSPLLSTSFVKSYQ